MPLNYDLTMVYIYLRKSTVRKTSEDRTRDKSFTYLGKQSRQFVLCQLTKERSDEAICGSAALTCYGAARIIGDTVG